MAAQIGQDDPEAAGKPRFDSRKAVDSRMAPAVQEDHRRRRGVCKRRLVAGDRPERHALHRVGAPGDLRAAMDLEFARIGGPFAGECPPGGASRRMTQMPREQPEIGEQHDRDGEGEEREQSGHDASRSNAERRAMTGAGGAARPRSGAAVKLPAGCMASCRDAAPVTGTAPRSPRRGDGRRRVAPRSQRPPRRPRRRRQEAAD